MKKLLSAALAIIVTLSCAVPAYAVTNIASTNEISEVAQFEEDVRQAGRVIAEERNLLLDAETFDAYQNRYNSVATMSKDEIETLYTDARAVSISLSDIYTENPELVSDALSIDSLDPVFLAPLSATYATPAFGDYRQQDYYMYSERIEYDSIDAKNYDALANMAISVVAVGLKPAQAIVIAILQGVIPANSWRDCSNYHVTTLYERCSAERWGEVYTSGGLLCKTDWFGYCLATRTDTYAIAVATTWKDNRAYSNSSELAKVAYAYDDKYYNTSYIKTRALALYKQAYDETYTVMYGVLPGYIEYNWNEDYSWKTNASNPFT